MHRSNIIKWLVSTLVLCCAMALPCAAQVANGPVQVDARPSSAPDPFPLGAPLPRSGESSESTASEGETVATDQTAEGRVLPAGAIVPLAQPALPRLAPRGEDNAAPLAKTADSSTLVTVGGSLTLVVGLFLLVAWLLRRGVPKGSGLLPRDVLEMLGRAPLPGRQQMHLIRIGSKLLLVNVTPHGAETLTEVTDPLEVDRLVGICQQRQPNSSTAAFRSVLDDLSRSGDGDEFGLDDAQTSRGRRVAHAARGRGGAHA